MIQQISPLSREFKEDIWYRTELATIAGGHLIVDIATQRLWLLADPCVALTLSLQLLVAKPSQSFGHDVSIFQEMVIGGLRPDISHQVCQQLHQHKTDTRLD